MLNLVLVGLNHRTAELEIRERTAFQLSLLPDTLKDISGRSGVREVMIISTCNRVELLSHVENTEDGFALLDSLLCDNSQLGLDRLREKTYRHSGKQVVRHVFRVASSLDSMILGEPQILGQLKSFYGVAVDARTVGFHLNSLLQAAFRTAKRVRTETSVGEYSVSVSSAAVELARKIFGDLRNKSILVIGAGKMGEVAVRHLIASGAGAIRVTNRSPEAARELALKCKGTAVPFEELLHWISQSDIIIASTGSPNILVNRAMAQSVMAERKNKPIVFIDISVPRNIDPEVATIDDVFCYDIDDLGAVVEANLHERRNAAAAAEKIVEQEVELYCNKMKLADATPVIVQLQGRIEEICRMELERYLRRAGNLDAKATQELESMVGRIAGKISHPLVTQLRNANQDPLHQEAYLNTIKRIFKIQKESD